MILFYFSVKFKTGIGIKRGGSTGCKAVCRFLRKTWRRLIGDTDSVL